MYGSTYGYWPVPTPAGYEPPAERTWRLVQSTPPAEADEVVTAEEMFTHSRVTIIDSAEEETLLKSKIKMARQYIENAAGISICKQSWRFSLDAFPRRYDSRNDLYGVIDLPRAWPLRALVVKYIDENGQDQTLAAEKYTVDKDGRPARVMPGYNLDWPATRLVFNAARFEYDCGFKIDPAMEVPETLRGAIMLLAAHLYENREATAQAGSRGTQLKIPFAVEEMLWQYDSRISFG